MLDLSGRALDLRIYINVCRYLENEFSLQGIDIDWFVYLIRDQIRA